jgi:hypothetical protein
MRRSFLVAFCVLAFPCQGAFADSTSSLGIEKYPSLVVEFRKDRSDLSEETKNNIRNFITKARAAEKIDDVYVAAWADRARVGDKSLSDGERKLAKDRAENIEKLIEDEYRLDVNTINMAKRSDFWDELFHPEEARVKGAKPAGHDRVAWRIQDEGRPSSAVLVVEPDRQSLSE